MRRCIGGPADGEWLEGDAARLCWITMDDPPYILAPDLVTGEAAQPSYTTHSYELRLYRPYKNVPGVPMYLYKGIEQR